jgi:surface polysaccharide O-acyltransferase-like enzyme
VAFSVDSPRAARAVWLDLFKTMLVYGMVAAHVIQLLSLAPRPPARDFSDFINLITFSGFLFAFGLGLGLSRKSHGQTGWHARLRPIVLLLLAVYASSLGYVFLVDRLEPTPGLLIDLLSMRRLYGWSEFLASFLVLYAAIALLRPILVKLARNVWTLVAASALCLASSLIVVSFDFPLIATLVGTTSFASFPLLPYLPWFLVGIYIGSHPMPPRLWLWAVALLSTAAFYLYLWSTGEVPQRFPPSALWVVGPALFLLVYLAIAHTVARAIEVPAFLLLPGRHVLSFLLVSNLFIFSMRYFLGKPVRDYTGIVGVTLAIILVLSLCWWTAEVLRRRVKVRQELARMRG